jgi:hypothetical protein
MTDNQRDILRMALEQMEENKGLVWGPEFLEEVAAALRALLDENAALKAERDQARREVCFAYGPTAEALAAAKRRGWDCFDAKEVKP